MKKIILISAVCSSFLSADTKEFETITISAQKTEQNSLEVPIAVSVFDDISLEDKKIKTLQDLKYFTPGLYITHTFDSPSIRGVYANPLTLSTSMGLYVDGVPNAYHAGFSSILNDIERVEILRGPQGTLYGRNAQAGVINVVTKKPSNLTEGSASLEYGSHKKKSLNLSLRAPIIEDKIYIGLSGRYYDKNGFMENSFLGGRANDRKNYFGKMYLRATPTDKLELSLISSFYKEDSGGGSFNSVLATDRRKLASDIRGYSKSSDSSHALKIAYDFDKFNLTSITSYKKNVVKTKGDFDMSPKKIFHSYKNIPYTIVSEELRLDGKIGNLKWLSGIYVDQAKKKAGDRIESDIPAVLKRVMFLNDDITQNTIGIFTHFDYAFNDKLSLIAGVRYDRDKKKIKSILLNDEKSFSEISPKFALNYKFHPQQMMYAQIAKGYRSGGFAIFVPPGYQKSFDEEILWNYEIGYKGLFFNKLSINADIYYMDISDMQVSSTIAAGQGGYMSNAASASSYGLELEANYLVNNNLSIFGNLSYSQSKFDEFKDGAGNYKDNYTPYAPKYTYALGATLRGLGGFYASADISGYGKMYSDKENKYFIEAYELVNAKLGYEWDNFDIYLYARNLFDKKYELKDATAIYLSNPREFGLQVSYRF